jgi:hypothetical protein
MAKQQKHQNLNKQLLVLIGLLVLLFFLGKTGFLGSLVTTCENTELTTIDGYISYLGPLNGTYTNITTSESMAWINENATNITFGYGNGAIIDIPSTGSYTILPILNGTCTNVLNFIKTNKNSSLWSAVKLDERNVMTFSNVYAWCSKNDQILLTASDINAFSNFVQKFEICKAQEIVANINESIVITKTTSSVVFSKQPTYRDPCLGIKCPDLYKCVAQGDTATCTDNGATEKSKTELTNTLMIVIGIIIGIVYFIYEKGPDKGIFQKGKKK